MLDLRQTLLHDCDEVFEFWNELHRGRQGREHPQLSDEFLLLYLFFPSSLARGQLLLVDLLFGLFFALCLVQVFL